MRSRISAASAGAVIVRRGEPGSEMFLISRAEVEVLEAAARERCGKMVAAALDARR